MDRFLFALKMELKYLRYYSKLEWYKTQINMHKYLNIWWRERLSSDSKSFATRNNGHSAVFQKSCMAEINPHI